MWGKRSFCLACYITTMSTAAIDSLYHTEFIDGQEVQKPLPKKLHALIQKFLLLALNRALPRDYEVLPELNVLCGAGSHGPGSYRGTS